MARRVDRNLPSPRLAALPLSSFLVVPSDVRTADANAAAPDWLEPNAPVREGQILLRHPSHSRASPVAPCDGTIGAPTTVGLLGGQTVYAVEFRPDEAATGEPDVGSPAEAPAGPIDAIASADLAAWLTRLQSAGVMSDRWTCPDLLGQLRDALSRPVDTLVANLLDSDPWLPISRVVCNSDAGALAAGLGLLGRLCGAKDWWALVDQGDDLEPALRGAAIDVARSLRIAPVENDYPQLDPSLLVRSTTGRRLRPGRLPTSLGVLVIDAAAAVAVGKVWLANRPMTRVPVVVYDQPADAICAVMAPVGVRAGWLLESLGIPSAVREVYAGGPLRQIRVREDQVIGPGELTLFAAPPQPTLAAEPCVRCGWCVEACPSRCRPAGLLEAAQQRDGDMARHNGLDACIECGLCTFVCPSRLPLLDGIRHIRQQIAQGLA